MGGADPAERVDSKAGTSVLGATVIRRRSRTTAQQKGRNAVIFIKEFISLKEPTAVGSGYSSTVTP